MDQYMSNVLLMTRTGNSTGAWIIVVRTIRHGAVEICFRETFELTQTSWIGNVLCIIHLDSGLYFSDL